jgi:hypothetical protein
MNIKYPYEQLKIIHEIARGESVLPLYKYRAIEAYKSYVVNLNKEELLPYYYKYKQKRQYRNKANKLLAKVLSCISESEIEQAKIEIEKGRNAYKAQLKIKLDAYKKEQKEKKKQTEKQLREQISELRYENKKLLEKLIRIYNK